MATCDSLHHIFDTLMPENATLLESLTWNQIKPIKATGQTPSFTEIFGELHFKESPIPISSSSTPHASSSTDVSNDTNRHKSSDSFSSLSSESLHLCTEGLGFESSDDVEDFKSGMDESWEKYKEKEGVKRYESSEGECRRSRVSEYPPPISSIGRSGKPWVCFKSYRSDGRFVLEEIRIPTHEFLHACREDGRLKLHFVHPEDEPIEEEEEDDDDDDDDDDVGSTDEEEEKNKGEEHDDCVTDHVNEEKEIDAQVTGQSLDENADNLQK